MPIKLHIAFLFAAIYLEVKITSWAKVYSDMHVLRMTRSTKTAAIASGCG